MDALVLVVATILLVLLWVVKLCLRVKKTWRNAKECRRLQKRAAWLRELLDLLQRPAVASEEAPATAVAVRTVLANRLRATVKKVDRVTSSWAAATSSCCSLFGYARAGKLAGKLERAHAEVNDVYLNVLPVVSQIDATHSVVLMLGTPHAQHRPLISQPSHAGVGKANGGHPDTQSQSARCNGSSKVDLEPLLWENDGQTSTGTGTLENNDMHMR